MKKCNSIRDFINHASQCLFCGADIRILIVSNTIKARKIFNAGVVTQKVTGQPLYRGVIEKSPLNMTYSYAARIQGNEMVFNCTEKSYLNKNVPQVYDVMSINLDNSDVSLKPEVEVGILNTFVRINFKFICMCEAKECSGHMYCSSGVLAGAKSKKLMPFFLQEETMSCQNPDDELIYTIHSNYQAQQSCFEKTSAPSDYINPFNGLLADSPPVPLPLVDLSNIKSQKSFLSKAENYVTFS